MGWLAALLLSVQGPSLVERLGDDDPAVRDGASAELARQGDRAVSLLVPALSHACAEVRGRAADLLFRRPDFRWMRLLVQPDSPFVLRAWNAIVDACVAKRPIPVSLWRELGEEEPVRELRPLQERVAALRHEPAWIVGRMGAESWEALRFLSVSVGIEGPQTERTFRRGFARISQAIPFDLLSRLSELGAGERAQEEIYATILLLQRGGLFAVFSELGEEDWDSLLRFMIHVRDRSGDKDPRPPRSLEEAVERAARGPWIAGIAGALARHFGSESTAVEVLLKEQLGESTSSRSSRWASLALVYDQLALIDAELSGRFWLAGVGERRALPRRRPPTVDRESPLLEAVCRLGPLDPEALGVVEALVESIHRSDHPEIQAGLIRALARGVVEAARR